MYHRGSSNQNFRIVRRFLIWHFYTKNIIALEQGFLNKYLVRAVPEKEALTDGRTEKWFYKGSVFSILRYGTLKTELATIYYGEFAISDLFYYKKNILIGEWEKSTG